MSSDPQKRPIVTNKLDLDERRTLVIPAFGSLDPRFNAENIKYHPIPWTYATIENAPIWRMVLKFGSKPKRVTVGLDVYGDSVFGRGSYEPDSPDIDLSNLDALERGVSRTHALLRPGPNSLYLVDLSSTNGTFVNDIQLKPRMAQRIHNQDVIRFSGLTCLVEIVSPPSYAVELAPADTREVEIESAIGLSKPRTGTETIFGVKLELPPQADDPDPKM